MMSISRDILKMPNIDSGNIVSMTFDEAELIFTLPETPDYHNKIDRLIPRTDFTEASDPEWDTYEDGGSSIELATQNWIIEHAHNYDELASCTLELTVSRLNPKLYPPGFAISPSRLEQVFIEILTEDFVAQYEDHLDDPSWPLPENEFKKKIIPKPHLNWFQFQISKIQGGLPGPLVAIPVNTDTMLIVTLDIGALHYTDHRVNPLTDNDVLQIGQELCDKFLSNIHIRYSSELIQEIEAQKAI